ncbi:MULTISPECIES: hypothetical protein [Streptomyces]|uniref:hypothetical protein n=1 Tax=Streptomyces TaxID=1883 RepID=UPI000B9DEBD6|nr:hypothetical protein [Streptomyces kasugaensis]
MSAASPDSRPKRITRLRNNVRWLPALAAALTALAVILLILTGNTGLVTPVAALGTAITGGTAGKVTINIRR